MKNVLSCWNSSKIKRKIIYNYECSDEGALNGPLLLNKLGDICYYYKYL